MKVVGIVTEYNPFHNGHKYHIEEAKKLTGADYVIAVMSGNFVTARNTCGHRQIQQSCHGTEQWSRSCP